MYLNLFIHKKEPTAVIAMDFYTPAIFLTMNFIWEKSWNK